MIKCWLFSLSCTIYILVAYFFIPNSLYLQVPYHSLTPLPFCFPTGNHQFLLCESVPLLLYVLVCCIFEILHVNDIIHYLSFSLWLIPLTLHAVANFILFYSLYNISHPRIHSLLITVCSKGAPCVVARVLLLWRAGCHGQSGRLGWPPTQLDVRPCLVEWVCTHTYHIFLSIHLLMDTQVAYTS